MEKRVMEKLSENSNIYQERMIRSIKKGKKIVNNLEEEIIVQKYKGVPDTPFPIHQHSHYEIIYCCKGKMSYVVNNQRLLVEWGDVLVIHPHAKHCPLVNGDVARNYERIILHVKADLIDYMETKEPKSMQGLLSGEGFCLYKVIVDEEGRLKHLFEQMLLEQQHQDIGFQTTINVLAIRFFIAMGRANVVDVQKTTDRDDLLLDEILLYISRNYKENITVNRIAENFSISHAKLSKLFREKIGVSCYQWIIECRVDMAIQLLEQGISLKEIWQCCGFSDYTSFYRMFKKFHYISPQEYKKNVNNSQDDQGRKRINRI